MARESLDVILFGAESSALEDRQHSPRYGSEVQVEFFALEKAEDMCLFGTEAGRSQSVLH